MELKDDKVEICTLIGFILVLSPILHGSLEEFSQEMLSGEKEDACKWVCQGRSLNKGHPAI